MCASEVEEDEEFEPELFVGNAAEVPLGGKDVLYLSRAENGDAVKGGAAAKGAIA